MMDNDTDLLTPATTDASELLPHSPPQALAASSVGPSTATTPLGSAEPEVDLSSDIY